MDKLLLVFLVYYYVVGVIVAFIESYNLVKDVVLDWEFVDNKFFTVIKIIVSAFAILLFVPVFYPLGVLEETIK